jgi:hypothetical protein
MILRREAARRAREARVAAGHQYPVHVHVPESLEPLRAVLLGGNTPTAIEALRRPEYAADATAQLVLARFLVLEHRFDEAITVCDRAAAIEATSGSRSHRTDEQ